MYCCRPRMGAIQTTMTAAAVMVMIRHIVLCVIIFVLGGNKADLIYIYFRCKVGN